MKPRAAGTELSKQVHVLGYMGIGVQDVTATVIDRETMIDVALELKQE
jgi:hypothetical protein